jgi:hypothetical protein
MYKVLLKIDRVSLRIKETVELHVVIRKEHKHFTHSRGEWLKNGEAVLSSSSEFLIDAKSPKFEIEVYLLSGETKKKGGVVLINLKPYPPNTSHRITEAIKKTPLVNSTISLEFLYVASEYALADELLISLQKAEEMHYRNSL